MMSVDVHLRLSVRAHDAVRRAARRSGRSQQALLREAVDRYLGLAESQTDLERALTRGMVRAPTPFRDVRASVRLEDQTSLDLLER